MGGYISSFLCNVIACTYPTYASFKAIESSDKDDDTQWLMYWVVYSVISVVESFTDWFVFWVPFYYELKLALLLALQVPQLKLAATLYNVYIQPFLKQNEKKIDSMVDEAKDNLKNKAKDVITNSGPQMVTSLLTAQTKLMTAVASSEAKHD